MATQKWEYMLIEWSISPMVWMVSDSGRQRVTVPGIPREGIVGLLNAQGDLGWELVGTSGNVEIYPAYVYLLKRPMA